MTEYTTLRNTDLQKLLADRNLSVTGSKVTMIERLQDDDAAKKRSLPLRNPDGAAEDLRRSVHHENLDKRWFQPRKERPSMSRRLAIQRRLNKGKCMEPSCCLCGTGTLSEATEALFGRSSKCTDGTCLALNVAVALKSPTRHTFDAIKIAALMLRVAIFPSASAARHAFEMPSSQPTCLNASGDLSIQGKTLTVK